MSSLRARRVENEWRILQQAAKANAGVLEIEGRHAGVACEAFLVTLRGTNALVKGDDGLKTLSVHRIELRLEEFFPAVPMQVFLSVPIVHPNVNPYNGFVCLWDRFAPGDSVLAALAQLQRVITWKLFNPSPEHLMQPDAFLLHAGANPLPYTPINEMSLDGNVVVNWHRYRSRPHRKRLSVADR
jgi:ubiquitin-protein ligase